MLIDIYKLDLRMKLTRKRNHNVSFSRNTYLFLLVMISTYDYIIPFQPNLHSRPTGRTMSLPTSKFPEENNESSNTNKHVEINFLDGTRLDSEERPRRLKRRKVDKHENERSSTLRGKPQSSKEKTFRKWGVHIHKGKDESIRELDCPSTFDSVAQDCFHAISSTLYCRNFLDPNIASNAMAVSVTDKRPVGFAYWPKGRDVGRLGVEIDHARFLLSGYGYGSSRHKYADVEGRALRRFVLHLASKLSRMPWDGLEENDNNDNSNEDEEGLIENQAKTTRPIAVFFNTINQALMASREMQMLRKIAILQNQDTSMYDNIRILCLGQDTIPTDMLSGRSQDKRRSRKKWGSSREKPIDPKNGLVIVAQPTDYNFESSPPAPSIGTVQDLQRILSRASLNEIASVVISPRLTEHFEGREGIEQSGYQESSTYGGIEPPRGPTPWLLRDFIPPVYSWIGCALELTPRPPSKAAVIGSIVQEQKQYNGIFDENNHHELAYSYYSRVAMTQTIMESGHPWHFYTVENNVKVYEDSSEMRSTKYLYLASTNPHSGRPSRDLLKNILSEFTSPT